MGRDLFRRKALAPLPLALALLIQPLVLGAEPGLESALRAAPARPLRAQPPGGVEVGGPPWLQSEARNVRHSRSAEPEYGLEVPDHPAILRWEEHYAGLGAPELLGALERARLFRRWIAEQLKEQGLPQELLFLPILESHYRVRATSRSGATGLWQIMANTSAPLGLKRNLWLDERRDFWLATAAALRKLGEDYRRFGSWPLALAAYNCGGGCLSRAIHAGGSEDFWELRDEGFLPRETAEYVPKFYALLKLCSYPGRHGLALSAGSGATTVDPWGDSPSWVRVQLDRSVELALLSRAAAIPEQLLALVNAELNLAVTPPGGYALKIPAENEERVRAVLADPEIELLRFQFHTVRTGDTFYGLSRYYGVSVEMIRSANPAVDPRRIRIGMTLRMPVAGSNGREPPPPELVAKLPCPGRYTVQPGDTLWAISRRYGTTPELLAAANDRALDALLQPGETLKVPGTEGSREGSGQ